MNFIASNIKFMFGKRIIENVWSGVNLRSGSNRAFITSELNRKYEDLEKVNTGLLSLLIVGLVGAVWVGWCSNSVGQVLLWCVACLAVGATTGFLFGVPRSGKANFKQNVIKDNSATNVDANIELNGRENESGRPNTNLEEVSDWLTKILVGLALVNLKSLEERVAAISINAAASLNSNPSDSDISTATALIVGFSVIGFLCGYLYTRLFLQGAMIRADKMDFGALLQQVTNSAVPGLEFSSGSPSVPSSSERKVAEQLLHAAPIDQPDEVLKALRTLAVDYESVRCDMPFGNERTRKMSEIASGMKRLALVAMPFLSQLARSTSPGERLAAVMILQMQFDPAYIEWLAERLIEEPAFPGYQAASALLARMPIVGEPERLRIKAAVQAAMKKRIDLKLEPEVRRDALVDKILTD